MDFDTDASHLNIINMDILTDVFDVMPSVVSYVSTIFCSDRVYVTGSISYGQYKDKNDNVQRAASIIAGC